MPALPYPQYPLSNLFLFPIFQTREAYRQATGQEPPPWDPQRPSKAWFDPQAHTSPRRNVVYDAVLAMSENGNALAGPDGKPMLDILLLKREEAATVNIPPKGPGTTNLPGTEVPEVPFPLRALEPNEELAFEFGGIVVVRNKELYPLTLVGFTAEDRALVKRIAAKLGV